jgi:hypothetical protein
MYKKILIALIALSIFIPSVNAGWWNTSWLSYYPLNISNTDSLDHSYEIMVVNISETECADDPDSTRVIKDNTTEIDFEWDTSDKERLIFIRNSTISSGESTSNYSIYCNNSGVSEDNITIFEGDKGYNDFEKNLTTGWAGASGIASNSQALQGNRSLYWDDDDAGGGDPYYYNLSDVANGHEIETVIFDIMPLDTATMYVGMNDEFAGWSTSYVWLKFDSGELTYYDGSGYNHMTAYDASKWISIKLEINWTSDNASYCYQNVSSDWACFEDDLRTAGTSDDADYFQIEGGGAQQPEAYIDRFSISTGAKANNMNSYLNFSNSSFMDVDEPSISLDWNINNDWYSSLSHPIYFYTTDSVSPFMNCTLTGNGYTLNFTNMTYVNAEYSGSSTTSTYEFEKRWEFTGHEGYVYDLLADVKVQDGGTVGYYNISFEYTDNTNEQVVFSHNYTTFTTVNWTNPDTSKIVENVTLYMKISGVNNSALIQNTKFNISNFANNTNYSTDITILDENNTISIECTDYSGNSNTSDSTINASWS